jgi:membrane protein YdbS with pleckstrin-like domain
VNAATADAGFATVTDHREARRLSRGWRQTLTANRSTERRPITMLGIIALVLIAVVALTVVGFAVHLLFSPLVLVAVIAVLAWIKFGPRRSRQ